MFFIRHFYRLLCQNGVLKGGVIMLTMFWMPDVEGIESLLKEPSKNPGPI